MGERLAGRCALVTGASRGIGRGIALAFAREGADVAVLYRRKQAEADAVAVEVEALGRRATVQQADVASWDEVKAAVGAAADALGGLDLVVANAGVASRMAPVIDIEPGYWRRVLAVDLDGAFHTARAALPHLLAASGERSLLFLSSVGADLCPPFGAPYYVAKAGVNALTRVLAKEVAASGVRVNAIASGIVHTEMGDGLIAALGEEAVTASVPVGFAGDVDDVAGLAVYLASPDARYVTGQVWRIDGGMTA